MTAKRPSKDFPVVCVGGSAGGLDAYIRLLKHLPPDMGVAIVIVNHLRTVDTRLAITQPLFFKRAFAVRTVIKPGRGRSRRRGSRP